MRILVSGMVAGIPYQGGATWAVLQYLLGFRRLGHSVYFVEPVRAAELLPPDATLTQSRNAMFFWMVMEQFRFERSAALLEVESRQTIGLRYRDLERIAASTDVLFNISGMLTDDILLSKIPRRVFVDLDPPFVQFWHTQGINMHLDAHTHFVTIARAMGEPDCRVPTCGKKWITTFQPVVLDQWQVTDRVRYDALTTIGNWRAYGSVEHDGVFYGQKAHSLRRLMDLPKRTSAQFLLALSIHPGEESDLSALRENGWHLLNPAEVAATPDSYRAFIQDSKAEFGIAKSGYEAAHAGWFSDRSICYLASGRPVLAQDTGYSRYLPTGQGLFSFSTSGDVVAGIEELNRDYAHHSHAARELAVEYFDSDRVLSELLDQVGGTGWSRV